VLVDAVSETTVAERFGGAGIGGGPMSPEHVGPDGWFPLDVDCT
jgi:hypothetical protein